MQSKTSVRLWLLGSTLGLGAVLFGVISLLTSGGNTASASATNAAIETTTQTIPSATPAASASATTATPQKKVAAPMPSTRTRTS